MTRSLLGTTDTNSSTLLPLLPPTVRGAVLLQVMGYKSVRQIGADTQDDQASAPAIMIPAPSNQNLRILPLFRCGPLCQVRLELGFEIVYIRRWCWCCFCCIRCGIIVTGGQQQQQHCSRQIIIAATRSMPPSIVMKLMKLMMRTKAASPV